jgi:hypothetical protein
MNAYNIKKADLEKQYQNGIIAIQGYLKDAKTFGFEIDEFELLKIRLNNGHILKQLKQLENESNA